MLSNLPFGASADRSAPFNQAMTDEPDTCRFEHFDASECDEDVAAGCFVCETPCCKCALVNGLCQDCALRHIAKIREAA